MSESRRDNDYDVIVAGSGVAGLSSALTAAEMGLTVVVLEKANELGGTTALANTLWVGNNHLAKTAGYTDKREDVIRYMEFVGGGELREPNLLAFVDRGPEALQFIEDCGVKFRLMTTDVIVDHYYPDVPGSMGVGRNIEVELISENDLGALAGTVRVKPDESTHVTQEEVTEAGGHQNLKSWDQELLEERRAKKIRGRGAALVIHLLKQLLEREVPIERGTGVEELIEESGRVIGAVTTDGRRLRARYGVVLATGGYESNPALMERFENLPGCRSMFVETSVGDGLILGSKVGGGVATIHNNMAALLGFEVPATASRPATFRLAGILELLSPHTMVVNYKGKRFADETYFQVVNSRLREFDVPSHRPANWPCFLIFDQQYVDNFSFGGGTPGAAIPEWVERADTVEELADKLGIPSDELKRTVSRMNDFARTGIDEDFNRPSYQWTVSRRESWGDYANPSLGTIERPPYYGVQLYTAPFSSAGLSTNENGQVTGLDDKPIPGLYAAGNAAAHREYGVGYQAGYSLASGMIFGYLAARHMAEGRRSRV